MTKRVVFHPDPKQYDKTDSDFVIQDAVSHANYGSFGKIKEHGEGDINIRCYHTLIDNFGDGKDLRWGLRYQKEMTIALAAYSLECLKSLGAEVVLYTNIDEAQCLPYDEVHILDIKDTKFWACGKQAAMKAELGKKSVSIDTDLFVYDSQVLERINAAKNICSHQEDTQKYRETIKELGSIVNDKIGQELFHKDDKAYNVGILKLNDEKANKYIRGYDMIRAILRRHNFSKGAEQAPDLIAEQVWLGALMPCIDTLTTQEEVSKLDKADVGFCHLIAFDKFFKIRQVLNVMSKSTLSTVKNIWHDMNFEINEMGLC